MAPLFSKVDLNKLWNDVQNEETLICAKFGKDLFNISKVIGRKNVAQFFLTHNVHQIIPAEYYRAPLIIMTISTSEAQIKLKDTTLANPFRRPEKLTT